MPFDLETELRPLIQAAAHKRIVMLGECTHGTHEFYTLRNHISRTLMRDHGFDFVCVEGDWPDCYQLNQFAKHQSQAADVSEVMKRFDRWPQWMWSNWETAGFIEWLAEHNTSHGKSCGFYGLDIYSLWDSLNELVQYFEKEDAEVSQAIIRSISCFDPFQQDEQAYARSALKGHRCRSEVASLLARVRDKSMTAQTPSEAAFSLEQNALISVNAEEYYSKMMDFSNESWNIRDQHMMQTLNRLLDHHGPDSKAIVWAHNTHVGDAAATEMKDAGMINIGQLAREQYGMDEVLLVGLSTYEGMVMAGSNWGAPMREMPVPAAKRGSLEAILHAAGGHSRIMKVADQPDIFRADMEHRAIGVVYTPSAEPYRNYMISDMRYRYDYFAFVDQTRAVHPIAHPVQPGLIPQSFPSGQ